MNDAASKFAPSPTLKSRSFIGLVCSQFLAAFNDQASNIVATFYGIDMLVRFVVVGWIDAKAVIAIVTACFITPFFLFSPLAGILADKYSKRNIIVFWKFAEVGIMGVALFALLLPHTAGWGWASPQTLAVMSSVLMISIVFLMGTHSTFFIPAKYGMMPEILETSILSRGNGLLEGTSFVATILGTVFGGVLYGATWIKSEIDYTAMVNVLHPGREWIIGLVLFSLALLGALASLIVERIPAAAPEMTLSLDPLVPLKKNLGVLKKSRPLILAAVGIAFFSLMTLYLRQSLLFHGETVEEIERASQLLKPPAAPATADALSAVHRENADTSDEDVIEETKPDSAGGPQLPNAGAADGASPVVEKHSGLSKAARTELEVSIFIGLVGLGVGIGCSLAGYFSGNRLELGLVPIGLSLLILTTAIMALAVPNVTIDGTAVVESSRLKMIACLIAVGVAAGLYIVPLYTLLQHRSPKDSKGNLVATSNFLNVVGGLLSVVVFYFITAQLQSFLGSTLHLKDVKSNPAKIPNYQSQLIRALRIPKLLFLLASVITMAMLALIWWMRPDFVLRAFSWIKSSRRRHLRALGLDNIPANGQVILISNSHDFDHWIHIVSTVDRFTRFVAPPDAPGDRMLRAVALNSGVMIAANRKVQLSAEDNALARGLVTLGQGYILGLSLAPDFAAEPGPCAGEHLLGELRAKIRPTILPVYCGEQPAHPEAIPHPERHTYVVIGEPMAPDTPLDEVRAAVAALGS